MRSSFSPSHLATLTMISLLPACASAPLVEGGGLTSYAEMAQSDGLVTKSRVHVNKDLVLAAKTVHIVPTTFPSTAAPKLSVQQRILVANAVSRALCIGLSDRFKVVTPEEPADLLVRASVTRATETNEIAAGLSAAASIGANFTNLPVPIPRIPIGLGALSIEAEAIDSRGRQQAGILWARGANALFSSPRISKAADAYELAEAFGEDFGYLLVKGKSPFVGAGIDVPSLQKINSAVGLAPKYAACERFGRSPGIAGLVGSQLGLPPEWTDGGAKQAARDGPPEPGRLAVRNGSNSTK